MIETPTVAGWQLRLELDPSEPVQLELSSGRPLPIADPVVVAAADAAAAEQERRDKELARQGALFDPQRQWPLPLPELHPPENGKAPCVRGYRASAGGCFCHACTDTVKVRVETCARQRCSSSAESNTMERARDAWNGTSDDEADRLGLRHFGGVPWGVFVVTAPYEIRSKLHGEGLRAFRRVAAKFVATLMRAHARDAGASFYLQAWLHPVGEAKIPRWLPEGEEWSEEEASTDYHPHENIMVPMVALLSDGSSRRLKPLLPKEWMGGKGAGRLLRAMLVEEFGQWWGEGKRAPLCNWFFEFRKEPEEKMHSLKYFSRVWPRWAKHPHVWIRPRALELKHWKRKEQLHSLLDQLCMEPLPEFGACSGCFDEGLSPGQSAQGVGATPEAASRDLVTQVENHRATCEACATRAAKEALRGAGRSPAYAQHRRIILPRARPRATGPPSQAPPAVAMGGAEGPSGRTPAQIWSAFMGATGGAFSGVQ